MSTTKTLAKGTAWGLFAAFALKFLAWFYWIILARMVSQEEIGVYSSVLSLMSIVILFSDLGLGSGSVGRYVPTYAGHGLYNHIKRVLKLSLIVGVASSIVFMGVVFVAKDYLSGFYHTERVVPVFEIMAFYIVAYNVFMIAVSFLNGRKLIKLASYSNSIHGLLKLVLTLALVFFVAASAESLALGFVLSYAVAGILAWSWAIGEYKKIPDGSDNVNDLRLLSEMIPFGMTIVVLTSMYLINSQFDSIMLGHLLPTGINMKMVGIYALVVSFSTITNIFANSIGGIFHPLINELWAQKKTEEMEKASSDYIRWIAILTTPVMVTIAAFSYELITILYGAGYGIGATSFAIYSLGLFIYSFSYPVQNTLSGMRRLDITIKTVGAGMALNIVLNLLLIPSYGMDGSAIASLVSFTLMTALFIRIRKKTYLHIPKDIHKPLVSGLLAFMILMAIKSIVGGGLLTGLETQSTDAIGDIMRKMSKAVFLAALMLVSSTIYLMILVALRTFTKEDIDLLAGAMRRFRLPERLINLTTKILSRQ